MKPLLDALPRLSPNGLRTVSLFAGGGLLDLGVIHAGFNVVQAFEFDVAPTIAYLHNIGGHIVGPRNSREKKAGAGDVTKIALDDVTECDVIIGGPPCQDYSVAGTGAGENGERGRLVWRYLEIIEAKRPKAFLFENVKGLVGKRHRPTFDALLAKFEDIGYRVSWRVLSAWDFGVAQKRERVFIVGIREDLGVTYEFPASEYETNGYRPVLRDAIGDLPEPFPNHIEKPLTDAVYRHARIHNIGYNTSLDAPDATIRTKGEDVLDVANHGIGDYWTPPNDYSYAQANRIQSMDEPSSTILAHHNTSQPIHPLAAPRRFTARECLRIQSVPDSYVFPPQLSLSAMYKATGNGVPPRMAYHLAKALAEQLLAINDRKEANPPESRKQVA